MPVKQVTCSICGETVNKAQTLSIGENQRACRKHSEVNDLAQNAQQQLKQENDTRHEANKKPKWIREPQSETEVKNSIIRCFCCKDLGYRQDIYFKEILICQELYELKTGKEINILNLPPDLYEPMNGIKCLWVIPYEEKLQLEFNARQAAKIIGFAAMCANCCDKQNIKYKTGLENLKFNDFVKNLFIFDEIKSLYRAEAKKRLQKS